MACCLANNRLEAVFTQQEQSCYSQHMIQIRMAKFLKRLYSKEDAICPYRCCCFLTSRIVSIEDDSGDEGEAKALPSHLFAPSSAPRSQNAP